MATASGWHEGVWILLWSVMGGAIGVRVRSLRRWLLLAASGLLLLGLADYLAFVQGWWVPLVPPAIAWLSSATVVTAYMVNQERQQRALLMQLFAKYVPNKEGKRSLDGVLIVSMAYRFMEADILAILAKIKIATYCIRKG
jgi:hypothetical protein